MLNLGGLVGTLDLDTGKFDKGLERSERNVQQFGAQSERTFGGISARLKDLGKLAGAFVVGAGIKGTISAASDLNETLSKSNVIFGKGAKEIDAWGKTAAKSMGLSRQAALEAAAGFGDMFSQIGFSQDAAASMSKQVVQLAADLGSFNNLPTADVLDMIAGGFRGEYDSLQRVIPNINAARVQTEALTETGKKNAAQLTAQEKVQATLNIVMQDGARAQGDFARTAGGAANSQKIAAAEAENLKAKIGSGLLPIWITALHVVSTLTTFVNEHSHELKILGGVVLGTWAAYKGYTILRSVGVWFDNLSASYKQYVAQLSYGNKAQQGASKALQNMSTILPVVGVGVGVLTAAWAKHKQEQAENQQRVDELTASLDKQTGAITEDTRATIANQLQKQGLFDVLLKLGVSQKTATDAALGDAYAMKQVFDATKGGSIQAAQAAAAVLQEASALNQAGRAHDNVAAATANSTAETQKNTVATGNQARKVMDLSSALDKLSGRYIGSRQAQLRYRDSLAEADALVKENGASLDENTAKGRANQEWLLDRISDINSVAEAQQRAGNSTDVITQRMQENEAALRKAAKAAGLNVGEVDKLIKKYAAVPEDIVTTIYTKDEQARRKLQELQAMLQALAGANTTITVRANGDVYVHQPGVGGGHFASGSPDTPPGWAWTGETGRELVQFPAHSKVIDHNRSEKIAAAWREHAQRPVAGGSTTVNLVANYPEPENLTEAAPRLLRMAQTAFDPGV